MGKHDWNAVDWTKTNAQIAAALGIRAVESVARKRRELGKAPVYPPTPTERIAALERECEELKRSRSRVEWLARRLLGILRSHDCDEGGFTPGELLIIQRAKDELREVCDG